MGRPDRVRGQDQGFDLGSNRAEEPHGIMCLTTHRVKTLFYHL